MQPKPQQNARNNCWKEIKNLGLWKRGGLECFYNVKHKNNAGAVEEKGQRVRIKKTNLRHLRVEKAQKYLNGEMIEDSNQINWSCLFPL